VAIEHRGPGPVWHAGSPVTAHQDPIGDLLLVRSGRDTQAGDLAVPGRVGLGLTEPERGSGAFGEQVCPAACELAQLRHGPDFLLCRQWRPSGMPPDCHYDLCVKDAVAIGLPHVTNIEQVFEDG
jgi:hypothetical protein